MYGASAPSCSTPCRQAYEDDLALLTPDALLDWITLNAVFKLDPRTGRFRYYNLSPRGSKSAPRLRSHARTRIRIRASAAGWSATFATEAQACVHLRAKWNHSPLPPAPSSCGTRRCASV
jgi:hypothetical protein